MCDDDEWIRLTEAEAITADIQEGQVTCAASNGAAHDQDVDPKKVRPQKENSPHSWQR